MSAPRRILPDKCSFITRRTSQRMFMLRPDKLTKQLFEFCLAVAAQRYNIGVIGWLVMSNHYHLIVHDETGSIPAFVQLLNRLLASTGNERWKRLENFWSSEPACITLLVTEEDLLEKLVYTLANPVKAKLVDTIAEWTGSSSLDYLDGKPRTIARPDIYFSRKSKTIFAEVSLRIVQPPESAKKESFEAWVARLKKRLEKVDADAAALRKSDPTFRSIGIEEVLSKKHTDRPPQKEEDGPEKPKVQPHLACGNPDMRIAEIKEIWLFRREHRDATLELAAPTTDLTKKVVFPEGTYRIPPGGRVVIGKRDTSSSVRRATKGALRIPCDPIDDLFPPPSTT